jgi:hypothetical protein
MAGLEPPQTAKPLSGLHSRTRGGPESGFFFVFRTDRIEDYHGNDDLAE